MKVFKNSYCKKTHIYLSFAFLISLIYSCTRETTKYNAIEKVRTYCLDFKNKKYVSFTKFNTLDSNIQINCLDSSKFTLTFLMEEQIYIKKNTKSNPYWLNKRNIYVYGNSTLYMYSQEYLTENVLTVTSEKTNNAFDVTNVCAYMLDYCHCIKQNKYDATLVKKKLKLEEYLADGELFLLTSATIGRFSYIYTIQKRQILFMREQVINAPHKLDYPQWFELKDSLKFDFFE